MAAKTDIVRVSYRDLENIAQKRDETHELSQGHSDRKGGIDLSYQNVNTKYLKITIFKIFLSFPFIFKNL